MRYAWLLLIALVACAQPEPTIAPTSHVVFCQPTQSLGEHCEKTCECQRSAECLNNICTVKRADGDACTNDDQCRSGYCTQTGHCGGPDGPNGTFFCERECRDFKTHAPVPCYTVCHR